ncbi:MAG: hypothetical protein JW838_13010 [Spirochaetes bacterium]|nr:hypothetical protein [Spirochaetota bacterium]
MKDIDEILLNIDRDDASDLVPETSDEERKKDELAGIIESIDEADDGNGVDVLTEETVSEKPSRAELSDEPDGAAPAIKNSQFTIRGSKSWNSREPYLIAINHEILAHDCESLKKSFYFVDAPTDHETIRIRVKQEIVTFLRRPDDHITERYAEYICTIIASTVDGLIERFEIEPEKRQLFIYHTGPLTIYKIIRDRFERYKVGQCYKYLPGNKASRYYPEEYIKFVVLAWFEENINTLDLPFDSIHSYEEIREIVMRHYQNDLRTFNMRFDQVVDRIGTEKKFSRNRLLSMKGDHWFGHGNMETYRRFLGASIFL